MYDQSAYLQQFQSGMQYDPSARLQQLEQQQRAMLQQQMAPVKPLEIPFVGGIDGAKGFNMPNGSNIILMDNTDPIFYMVQSDQSGMRNIRGYQFQEIELKQSKTAQNIDTSQFATKEDLNAIFEQIKDLKGAVLGQ